MKSYTSKNRNNQSLFTVNNTKKEKNHSSVFQCADILPVSVKMRKLQERVNDTPQSRQVKALQETANNNPQAKQVKALQKTADNRSQNKQPVTTSITGNKIIQRAKWRWTGKVWKIVEGHSIKGPPGHQGTRIGEIFDDSVSLGIESTPIRSAPSPVPGYMKYQPGQDAAYRQYLLALEQAMAGGYQITDKQRDQLDVDKSNAQYLANRLEALKSKQNDPSLQVPLREWVTCMEQIHSAAQNSVFTRDIDEGELKGQGVGGSTLDVVTRTKQGIGRIRTWKDLNRGGGAGSYVRFLSDKPRKRESGEESGSKPLNFGSLASLGVTLIYDVKAVVGANSAPAGMAFNKQDSAGRIFGTNADTEDKLRQQSGESQRLLGESNPRYYKRAAVDIPEHELSDEAILQNAISGMHEMVRQASEGQTDKEEYNEAVLFTGASVEHVKAILIHRPPIGKGRPPEKVDIPPERQERFQAKQTRFMQGVQDDKSDVEVMLHSIRAEIAKLRGTSRSNPHALNRILALSELESELIQEQNKLLLIKPKETLTYKYYNRREVTTSRNIRNEGNWEDGSLPDELSQWRGKTGFGAVPIEYLFMHVDPAKFNREELPALAGVIWSLGKQRWEEDKRRHKSSPDISDGITQSAVPVTQSSPLQPFDISSVDIVLEVLMRTNNCLINAVAMAALGRSATIDEIRAIRNQVIGRGFPIGSMLVASPAILNIIRTALNVHNGINVCYANGDPDDSVPGPHPLQIYHRGLHFSDRPF